MFRIDLQKKYGGALRVISRCEPTFQTCCCCGLSGGKFDLSIREWECLNFGVKHGLVGSGPSIPSENAARNILVADGHGETKNGQVGQYKITAKIAAPSEMSTHRGAEAQYGSPCL